MVYAKHTARSHTDLKRSLHRPERVASLAEKLREVFLLEEAEQVLAEYPCWLFRSVLSQGFLYLTKGYLCFYAYLKSKEGQTIRSGMMSKRSNRTRLYQKYWFVLKDAVLSWYPSSNEPYFPLDQIDLHYVTSIEPSISNELCFKIMTANKKYRFSTGSKASRQKWIKLLRKIVFKARNEGESVKVILMKPRVERI